MRFKNKNNDFSTLASVNGNKLTPLSTIGKKGTKILPSFLLLPKIAGTLEPKPLIIACNGMSNVPTCVPSMVGPNGMTGDNGGSHPGGTARNNLDPKNSFAFLLSPSNILAKYFSVSGFGQCFSNQVKKPFIISFTSALRKHFKNSS